MLAGCRLELIASKSQGCVAATRRCAVESGRGLGTQGLTARFAHLAQLNAELTEAEEARLQELLHYGEDFNAQGFSDAEFDAVFVVAPRVGTISPWSSKATDIARNCDLFKVDRLERVTAYWLQVSAELSADERALGDPGTG